MCVKEGRDRGYGGRGGGFMRGRRWGDWGRSRGLPYVTNWCDCEMIFFWTSAMRDVFLQFWSVQRGVSINKINNLVAPVLQINTSPEHLFTDRPPHFRNNASHITTPLPPSHHHTTIIITLSHSFVFVGILSESFLAHLSDTPSSYISHIRKKKKRETTQGCIDPLLTYPQTT